jgi:3-methyladenine DNA glycosylase AlkC
MTVVPKRKGAMRRVDVTADIRAQLNAGTLETLTLAEFLVVDHAALLKAIAPEMGQAALKKMQTAAEEGVTKRMALAGELLLSHFGSDAFERFAKHCSDVVRGFSAYALSKMPDVTLADKMQKIRSLADDPNPGVREWAWIALRPHVAENLEASIKLLFPWTSEESPKLRRYAVEITRPRGVWCMHIDRLKKDPELGLKLLLPLCADPEKYVQDSVANWLNDASKSKPEWVQMLCSKWQKDSKLPATARICKRALRSINA